MTSRYTFIGYKFIEDFSAMLLTASESDNLWLQFSSFNELYLLSNHTPTHSPSLSAPIYAGFLKHGFSKICMNLPKQDLVK